MDVAVDVSSAPMAMHLAREPILSEFLNASIVDECSKLGAIMKKIRDEERMATHYEWRRIQARWRGRLLTRLEADPA